MKQKMIANSNFPYAGRALKAEEAFDAESDQDALILSGSGKARRAGRTVDSKEQATIDDDEAIEGHGDASGTGMNGAVEGKPRRRYRRRDMRAQGT
jgi:hypothetical protein